MASLEGDNLVIFYYLGESEIRPDEKVGLWLEGPCHSLTTVPSGVNSSRPKRRRKVSIKTLDIPLIE